MKWIKDSITDYDNTTYDTGRVIAFVYFLSAIVFTGYNLAVLHNPFDVQGYLVGGGGFLGGLGVYLFGDKSGRTASTSEAPK